GRARIGRGRSPPPPRASIRIPPRSPPPSPAGEERGPVRQRRASPPGRECRAPARQPGIRSPPGAPGCRPPPRPGPPPSRPPFRRWNLEAASWDNPASPGFGENGVPSPQVAEQLDRTDVGELSLLRGRV